MRVPPAGGPGPSRGDHRPDEGPPDDEELDAVQRAVLRHETRRAIFETVARTPGLNKHQVATRLEIGHKGAAHHLRRLEAYDLIELVDGPRDDEILCFHVDDASLWETEATRILYGRAPCRRIALYVGTNPGCTTDELCQALDKRPRTIQEHLSTLRDRRLVHRVWLDRRAEYFPTKSLQAWGHEVGHRYQDPADTSHR